MDGAAGEAIGASNEGPRASCAWVVLTAAARRGRFYKLTSQPIKHTADVAGLKIRVHEPNEPCSCQIGQRSHGWSHATGGFSRGSVYQSIKTRVPVMRALTVSTPHLYTPLSIVRGKINPPAQRPPNPRPTYDGHPTLSAVDHPNHRITYVEPTPDPVTDGSAQAGYTITRQLTEAHSLIPYPGLHVCRCTMRMGVKRDPEVSNKLSLPPGSSLRTLVRI